jgi:hypothetical protein
LTRADLRSEPFLRGIAKSYIKPGHMCTTARYCCKEFSTFYSCTDHRSASPLILISSPSIGGDKTCNLLSRLQEVTPALVLSDLKIDESESDPSELQTLFGAFPKSSRNSGSWERPGLGTMCSNSSVQRTAGCKQVTASKIVVIRASRRPGEREP